MRAVNQLDVALHLGELRHMRASSVGVIPKSRRRAGLLELGHTTPGLVDMQIRLDLCQTRGEGIQLCQNRLSACIRRH